MGHEKGREGEGFRATCQHGSLACVCSAGPVHSLHCAAVSTVHSFSLFGRPRLETSPSSSWSFAVLNTMLCNCAQQCVATAVFSRCLRSQHLHMSPRRTRRGSILLLCKSTRFDSGSQTFTKRVLSLKIILRNVYNCLPRFEGTNSSFLISFLCVQTFSFLFYFRCTFFTSLDHRTKKAKGHM